MTRWFVPGRIEVFGKHTDYGGGRSLLAATTQGLDLSGDGLHGEVTVHSDAGGAHYVRIVVARLSADFGPPPVGADITVRSTLPVAAGMSSSSAFVTGLVLVLADLWSLPLPSGPALAEYLASVERGVGVRGGAEDHAAILLSRAGALLPCRFLPVRPEPPVAWPPDLVFVVAVSGVVAEKAAGAKERYNQTAGVLDAVERAGVPVGRLVDEPGMVEAWCARLGDVQAGRLRQFVEESAVIIPSAVAAIASGDWATFGVLAERSHRLGVDALGNAVPETEVLAARARSLGAIAASPFGAGFGGSVWAVVPERDAATFAERWHHRTVITAPGGPATRLT